MVHFVGAGPGACDLITVRGMNRIKEADVIICLLYTSCLIQIRLHFLILVCLKLVHQGGGICFDLPGGRDGDDVQQGLEQHEEQEQHTFDHHCNLEDPPDADVGIIDVYKRQVPGFDRSSIPCSALLEGKTFQQG